LQIDVATAEVAAAAFNPIAAFDTAFASDTTFTVDTTAANTIVTTFALCALNQHGADIAHVGPACAANFSGIAVPGGSALRECHTCRPAPVVAFAVAAIFAFTVAFASTATFISISAYAFASSHHHPTSSSYVHPSTASLF
jgi:hypothetical protein